MYFFYNDSALTSSFFFAESHNIEFIRIPVLLGQKPVAVYRAVAVALLQTDYRAESLSRAGRSKDTG